jgi:hypothetical protein
MTAAQRRMVLEADAFALAEQQQQQQQRRQHDQQQEEEEEEEELQGQSAERVLAEGGVSAGARGDPRLPAKKKKDRTPVRLRVLDLPRNLHEEEVRKLFSVSCA